jgi:hypothetical protein
MEMYPMSNVISLAQRMAARVDARAEAYKKRALADNFMDETETESYRDWKSDRSGVRAVRRPDGFTRIDQAFRLHPAQHPTAAGLREPGRFDRMKVRSSDGYQTSLTTWNEMNDHQKSSTTPKEGAP